MAQEKLRENRERLRNLNDNELADELGNERRKLYELRSQNTTRQLENTAALAAGAPRPCAGFPEPPVLRRLHRQDIVHIWRGRILH